MSDLHDLLNTLNSVNQDADRLAAKLAQQARQLGQAAQHAADVGGGSTGIRATQAANALQYAQRATTQASQLLHHAAAAGREFVIRNAGGNPLHGMPANSSGVEEEPRGIGSIRYLQPGSQEEAYFSQLVALFGAGNPEGWIGAGNPRYRSNEAAWTNNCGSCSRSFADTFQGFGVVPAYGDSKIPTGEYGEMWDAVGIQPSTQLTNSNRDPQEFTSSAFKELANQLQREGPGAVAIIGVDWDVDGIPRGSAGGHWFNAYIDPGGGVRWADEQIGRTTDWPPEYRSNIWRIEAVVRPSGSAEWKEIKL